MKNRILGVLLAGFLVHGSAMALTGDISISRSDNLAGDNYYSYISEDFYTATSYEYLRTDYSSSSVSKSVGAVYQDATSGKWYQPTEITTTSFRDEVHQTYQQDQRDFWINKQNNELSSAGDQWLDVIVNNADTQFGFSFYASGTAGSKTNSRTGFTQQILPAIGAEVDGVKNSLPLNVWSGSNTWSLSTSGSFGEGLKISVDATDGGGIQYAGLSIYANRIAGDLYHSLWTQSVNTDVTNLEVSAPVPEPESWAMLMAGLGLFGVIAKRRRKLAN